MWILFPIFIVLVIGIFIGFSLGYSRAMKVAAVNVQAKKRGVPAWFFGLMGCLFLICGLGIFVRQVLFVHSAASTKGIVTELKFSTDKDRTYIFAPIFSFEDETKNKHTIRLNRWSSSPQFQVGDTIPVLYSKKDPETAEIDTFGDLWALPLGFGMLGIVLILVGQVKKYWPKIVETFMARKNNAVANV